MPIGYRERFVNSQLDLCMTAVGKLRDRRLAPSLLVHIADLRTRALSHIAGQGALQHGHDYIVVAEPA